MQPHAKPEWADKITGDDVVCIVGERDFIDFCASLSPQNSFIFKDLEKAGFVNRMHVNTPIIMIESHIDDPMVISQMEFLMRYASHELDDVFDTSAQQMIQEAGPTAPRVTLEMVQAEIVGEQFHVFEGSCLTVCCLTLHNGFTVTGESACASPENFNAEIGRKVARDHAVEKIWPLLGFRLRDALCAEDVRKSHEARDETQPSDWGWDEQVRKGGKGLGLEEQIKKNLEKQLAADLQGSDPYPRMLMPRHDDANGPVKDAMIRGNDPLPLAPLGGHGWHEGDDSSNFGKPNVDDELERLGAVVPEKGHDK